MCVCVCVCVRVCVHLGKRFSYGYILLGMKQWFGFEFLLAFHVDEDC